MTTAAARSVPWWGPTGRAGKAGRGRDRLRTLGTAVVAGASLLVIALAGYGVIVVPCLLVGAVAVLVDHLRRSRSRTRPAAGQVPGRPWYRPPRRPPRPPARRPRPGPGRGPW